MTQSRFPVAQRWAADPSHNAMRVNLDACIQCNLYVRGCREVQGNDVIGMAYRDAASKVVFDFDNPMGASTCVACSERVQACPTGALMPAAYLDDAGTRRIRLETRRGAVEVKIRSDRDVPNGRVFMPFCYTEAAANLLTNPALDFYGKRPEFKFCAVRVSPVEEMATAAE